VPVLPIGFAHRGARSVAPDNTLRSFRLALQLGATGLESDAWVTADGVVVLDHDGMIGPRWRRQPISQVRRGGLPPHIPALAELYQECGADFELSLDLKDPTALEAVVAVAAAAQPDAPSRLWLCHPEEAVLAGFRHGHSDVHLVHSTSLRRLSDAAGRPRSPVFLLAATAAADRHAGIEAVNLRADQWTSPLVSTVHDAGLLAFGWDAQRPRTLDRLLASGIDGVYCDTVPTMVEAIARHQATRT
jgi:glycerophosphoryl diester phosphodiesterase